jgi:hypothetical protein
MKKQDKEKKNIIKKDQKIIFSFLFKTLKNCARCCLLGHFLILRKLNNLPKKDIYDKTRFNTANTTNKTAKNIVAHKIFFCIPLRVA